MYYEVNKVNGENEFESKHGKFISYHLTVTDQEGLSVDCYTNRKEESAAPIVGERIFGQMGLDRAGNTKLTKMQDPNYQGGGNAPQRPANTPRTHQPMLGEASDRDMQIIRQSSLKVATDIAIANAGDAQVMEGDVIAMAETFAAWAYTGKVETESQDSKDVPASDIPF